MAAEAGLIDLCAALLCCGAVAAAETAVLSPVYAYPGYPYVPPYARVPYAPLYGSPPEAVPGIRL